MGWVVGWAEHGGEGTEGRGAPQQGREDRQLTEPPGDSLWTLWWFLSQNTLTGGLQPTGIDWITCGRPDARNQGGRRATQVYTRDTGSGEEPPPAPATSWQCGPVPPNLCPCLRVTFSVGLRRAPVTGPRPVHGIPDASSIRPFSYSRPQDAAPECGHSHRVRR